MSEKHKGGKTAAPTTPAPAPAPAPTTASELVQAETVSEGLAGTRQRRAIMLRQMLPKTDWINVNVVSKGQGTKALIGRVFGVVTKTARKENTLPNGTKSESIVCEGTFESESYVTGEISNGASVYLPMAYAIQIEAAFSQSGVTAVEIDCDIGLEATGKTIPYEWVVIAYREGEKMNVLKNLRAARHRPAMLLLTAKPEGGTLISAGV